MQCGAGKSQHDVFVFVRQLVVCIHLTTVVLAASFSGMCSKVNAAAFGQARCMFATSRQIQRSMNNRNLNLGRWGFTLAACVDRRILLGALCAKLRSLNRKKRRRLGTAAPAHRAGGR
jgi:hypothetical protein